jgi:hypothetical protein
MRHNHVLLARGTARFDASRIVTVLALALAACGDNGQPWILPGLVPGLDAGNSNVLTPDAAAAAVEAGAPPAAPVGAGMDAGAGSADASESDAATAASADASADATPGDAGGDAASDASAEAGAFEGCVEALKKCSYEDKESACSSVSTAKIPLSDGGTWGNVEVKSGPYGFFVEWNEGMKFANQENFLEEGCGLVALTFGEPAAVTDDVLDLRGQDLKLYTIFRPACMHEGEKYPVITWGNGTCGQTGGYATLLATLASHGFVVVSANSRWTSGGEKVMLRALDLAKAINEDPTHVLYQRLDLDKVGAMGHSQGSGATAEAASDPRIDSVILWNGGTGGAVKPFLAVSGDRDIGDPTVMGLSSGVNAADQPGAWLFYHKVLVTGGNFTGHLTLMMQPERVIEPALAWWKYMLKGDQEAKKMFVGSDCGLCNKKDDYEFGLNSKPLP